MEMPLSTSIQDNLLHIITINPEVVVLHAAPPLLVSILRISSVEVVYLREPLVLRSYETLLSNTYYHHRLRF